MVSLLAKGQTLRLFLRILRLIQFLSLKNRIMQVRGILVLKMIAQFLLFLDVYVI